MPSKMRDRVLNQAIALSFKKKETSSDEKTASDREQFIKDCFQRGGAAVVESVRKYGVNEKGESIRLSNWFEEVLLLIGDFRVSETWTTGCAQLGKAQPLDAIIVTPSGFKRMKDISVGDRVITESGKAAIVDGVYPQGEKSIYRVWFCDDTYVDCCDDHLWMTQTSDDRRRNVKNQELQRHGTRQRTWRVLSDGSREGSVKTLKEIRETLYCPGRASKKGTPRSNHSLLLCEPVEYECSVDLPIPAYTMGILLGDGCFRSPKSLSFSSDDECVVDSIKSEIRSEFNLKVCKKKGRGCDWHIVTTLKGFHTRANPHYYRTALESLGLHGLYSHEKFVPAIYLTAGVGDRLSLLQGLLDSDGTCSKGAGKSVAVEFSCTSLALTEAVAELARSLGGYAKFGKVKKPFYYGKDGERINGKDAYRVIIRLPPHMKPFRLERKLKNWHPPEIRKLKKYIRGVEYIGIKEAQCISVDSPNHLYLTNDYTVTHNTLAHTLTLCHYITIGKLSAMWAYDLQTSRDIQVKANFWPVIEGRTGAAGWIGKLGIKKKSGGGAQNINVYQINGGEVQFPYVSTSKAGSGGAAAGGIAVGVSRDFLVKEERSQYAPGAGDVLNRRLDASRIPTRPIRNNGTPGGGLGIEAEIESDAEYHFYPHCLCSHCDRAQPLDPFGAMLKPELRILPNGEEQKVYLSESGRPIKWHHSDPSNPLGTAYFGCPECDRPLADEARAKAWYQCLKTGVRLRDYLDALPNDVPNPRQTAAIEITPLLRIEKTNTAEAIIREGLSTTNPADWCQQRCGKPSKSSQSAIALDNIRLAIGAPVPDREPDLIVAGIDQARRDGDHVWIQNVWLPDDWESLSVPETKEATIRQCVFYKAVPRDRIAELLKEFNVTTGLIDSEPDIPSANQLSKTTVLESADQKTSTMSDQTARGKRESGGVVYDYWKIRDRDFLDDVLYNFVRAMPDKFPPMRLPAAWEKWVTMLKDERSPIRHLLSMKRDPETRMWERPEDKKDGAFYAQMFAEAALTIYLRHEDSRPLSRATIPSKSGMDAINWLRGPEG